MQLCVKFLKSVNSLFMVKTKSEINDTILSKSNKDSTQKTCADKRNIMDMTKIGQFLSELRKERNMTQAQLGEKLGVTNKTVSRWETGTYMPPVEMLQILSELYDVSINEILSGQKLSDTDYKENAEENIKAVLSESAFTLKDKIEFFRKKWEKEHAFEMTVEMIILIASIIVGFIFDNGLQFATIIIAFVWCIVQYNRMMSYIENHAYGNDKSKKDI